MIVSRCFFIPEVSPEKLTYLIYYLYVIFDMNTLVLGVIISNSYLIFNIIFIIKIIVTASLQVTHVFGKIVVIPHFDDQRSQNERPRPFQLLLRQSGGFRDGLDGKISF